MVSVHPLGKKITENGAAALEMPCGSLAPSEDPAHIQHPPCLGRVLPRHHASPQGAHQMALFS